MMANELDPEYLGPDRNSLLVKETARNGQLIKRDTNIAKKRERKTMGQLKSFTLALWSEGTNHAEIVQATNEHFDLTGNMAITPAHVSKHVSEMLSFWKDKSLAHFDTKMALTLAQYNLIETLATEGYFASMKGKTTITHKRKISTAKTRKKKDEKVAEAVERERLAQGTLGIDETLENLEVLAEETQESLMEQDAVAGDPTFLKILVDINFKRSNLWALLNRAEQITGDQEMAKLSDEARTERIAAVIQQAKARALGNSSHLAIPSPLGGFKEGEAPEGFENMSIDPVQKFLAHEELEAQIVTQGEVDLDDLDWGD